MSVSWLNLSGCIAHRRLGKSLSRIFMSHVAQYAFSDANDHLQSVVLLLVATLKLQKLHPLGWV